MKKPLSTGAKVRALLLAGEIEFRAMFSADDERGYASEEARIEMREIAQLLRSAGQTHPGTHDDGRAYQCIAMMKSTGCTEREAARWVLAYRRWGVELDAALALNAEAAVRDLFVEFEGGLKNRVTEVSVTEAKRLEDQIAKAQARTASGGLNVGALT